MYIVLWKWERMYWSSVPVSKVFTLISIANKLYIPQARHSFLRSLFLFLFIPFTIPTVLIYVYLHFILGPTHWEQTSECLFKLAFFLHGGTAAFTLWNGPLAGCSETWWLVKREFALAFRNHGTILTSSRSQRGGAQLLPCVYNRSVKE